MKKNLILKDFVKLHRITSRAVHGWVSEGMPHTKRRNPKGGRKLLVFHNAKAMRWLSEKGRVTPFMAARASGAPAAPAGDPAQLKKRAMRAQRADAPPPAAEKLGILASVERLRLQEYKTSMLMLRLKDAGADSSEIVALQRQLSQEVNALRLAEMDLVKYQQQTGDLCSFEAMARAWSEIALALRNRVMSIGQLVGPQLRQYLADPEKIPIVTDLIERYCREALIQVTDETPGRDEGQVHEEPTASAKNDGR